MKLFFAGFGLCFLFMQLGVIAGKEEGDARLAAFLILPIMAGFVAWGLS